MDDFEDFELTQEEITQLDNIEINLLNQSFQIDTDEEDVVQLSKRRCRRIVLSESEDSDNEIARLISDTVGNTSPSNTWSKPKDPHLKFFVPAPKSASSQETSDEGSVQFDSSSEEAKTRFVVKVLPSVRDRSGTLSVEIAASTTRWGISTPELMGDGAVVRELRQKRSCRSTYVAFLPAAHNATDVIRYCVSTREMTASDHFVCASAKKAPARTHCVNHAQHPSKVIVQKIFGLRAGKKYAIRVMASNRGSSVPYNTLYVDTNMSCKED